MSTSSYSFSYDEVCHIYLGIQYSTGTVRHSTGPEGWKIKMQDPDDFFPVARGNGRIRQISSSRVRR
eukprot:965947-Prorocentrum_minimum.AAC.1